MDLVTYNLSIPLFEVVKVHVKTYTLLEVHICCLDFGRDLK